MPQCTGCSKPYKFLDTDQCEPCTESQSTRTPKPRHEWPMCPDCSKRFEFMDKDKPCIACQSRSTKDSQDMPPPPSLPRGVLAMAPSQNQHQLEDVHYAMSHPVNARTHSTRGGPNYRNPLQTYIHDRDENDPRYVQAQNTFKDFANGYSDALSHANPRARIAKPKFKGIEDSASKPIPRINIVIRKIVNRNKKTLDTPFDPQVTTYDETRLWSDIEKSLITWLDGIYSQVHQHRIRSKDDFSLYYTQGRCVISNVSTSPQATIKDVWRKSTEQPGLLVLVKCEKAFLLELDALVNYPVRSALTEDADYGDSGPFPSGSQLFSSVSLRGRGTGGSTKRKAVEQFSSNLPFKRSNYSTSYKTDITASRPSPRPEEDTFTVSKITVALDNPDSDGTSLWSISDTKYEIMVDKKEFSAGSMKRAFKLRFKNSASVYAAKRYYEIGGQTEPTETENHQHLKEEIMRQYSIQRAVSAFTDLAISRKVSVYDLKIADAFLLQVSDAFTEDKDAVTWIVDPLLDPLKMRKFSGTNKAGTNLDFPGQTCDAFAHFTLADSMEFVAVDIQGIDMPTVINGIKGANMITLLDIMAHSKQQTMGLGDNGVAGIQEFCDQHKCNTICKGLGLPDLLHEILPTLLRTPEKDSDSLGVSILPPQLAQETENS